MVVLKNRAWRRLVALTRPFLRSSRRWRAVALLSVIIALLLTLNALNVANSYVGRNFITAIARREHARYVRFALLYLGVFAASTVTGVLQQFAQDLLALSWRDWVTRNIIDRYLSGHTFDRIGKRQDIDNPDQRITEDIRTFTTSLMTFVVMIANAVLTTIAFAGVLWSITPILLVSATLYAALGSVVTLFLGYRLVGLDNQQLKKEADLRYVLIHARERGDVRSLQEDARERRHVRARVRRVIHNNRSIIGVTRNVSFFTSGYNYLVQIIPILIVAPRYMHGTIELGVVTQSAMAFAQLLGAFSLIVAQFQSLSAFTAVIHRVGSLSEAIAEVSGGESHHGRPAPTTVPHSHAI